MDIQTLFKMKSKFVARAVSNELIIVPLSGNVAQMNELFTLNETAKFIWENIHENSTLETIKSAMTNEFDIDDETARKDLAKFMNDMNVLFKEK